MENNDENLDQNSSNYRHGVHFLLFQSYSIFLFAVILGAIFDLIINYNFLSNVLYQDAGVFLILFGSVVVYWAQETSGNFKEDKAILKNRTFFDRGPYKFLRHPTHFGLFAMTIGLALIINSLFAIIFTIIAYIITKIFFVKKQEKILEKKYGDVYSQYKNKVKNWI